jgi:hypothetical protein
MAQPAVVHPLEPLCEGWQHGLALVAHPWVLPELLAEVLAPWGGVTQVWGAGSPERPATALTSPSRAPKG